MGKGSSPRPYSVDQKTFDHNWDRIFKKSIEVTPEEDEAWKELESRQNMTPRVEQVKENVPSCGCGRSPTGKCIGWHGLTESEFQKRLAEYQAKNK